MKPLIILFLLGAATLVGAAQIYRYVNDDGIVVISTRLPNEYTKSGYEVIDQYGVVQETVGPQRTPAEYAAFVAKADAKRLCEAKVKRIRLLYSELEEIDQAETGQLEGVTRSIEQANADIAYIEQEQARIEKAAAQQERSAAAEGLGDMINTLEALDVRKSNREAEILKLGEEFERTRAQFVEDRELFVAIVDNPAAGC